MKNSDASVDFESPHSPLRFRSSPLSDNGDPFHSPENSPLNDHRDNSRAIVIVETSTQFAQSAPPVTESEHRNPPPNEQPEVVVTRPARPEARSPGAGPRGRTRAAPPPTLAVPKREVMLKKVALGFRLSEVVLCLISFSVMAADKTRGWSGDSFDRYKEYRLNFFSFFCGFLFIDSFQLGFSFIYLFFVIRVNALSIVINNFIKPLLNMCLSIYFRPLY